MEDKNRLETFARKFMADGIRKEELKSTGFFRSDMLY